VPASAIEPLEVGDDATGGRIELFLSRPRRSSSATSVRSSQNVSPRFSAPIPSRVRATSTVRSVRRWWGAAGKHRASRWTALGSQCAGVRAGLQTGGVGSGSILGEANDG
jgi:hypothetical protein